MKNIFIITEPRTGSNFLCTLFKNYKNVRVLNELFHFPDPKEPLVFVRDEEKKFLYKRLNLNTTTELSEFFCKNPKETLNILDKIIPSSKIFKIHRDIFQIYDFDFILDEYDVILLRRKKQLYQYVSYKIAIELDKWHSVDTNHIQITLNLNDYLKWKNSSNNYFEGVKSRLKNKNYLELIYEDHLENKNINTILDTLDDWILSTDTKLERMNNIYQPMFKKQNKRHISEIITNYDEIKSLLPEIGIVN